MGLTVTLIIKIKYYYLRRIDKKTISIDVNNNSTDRGEFSLANFSIQGPIARGEVVVVMGGVPQFTSSVSFVTGFLFINLKHTKKYDLADLFKFLNSDPNSHCLNLNLNDQKTSHFY